MSEGMSTKAAVIGAGLAGSWVSSELTRAGMEVVLFDKARGPAGRLSTRRTAETQFDHGAQYFTARSPRFDAAVQDWLLEGVIETWEGRFAVLEAGVARAEDDGPARYVGSPRMSALTRFLTNGIDGRFGIRVGQVQAGDAGWLVTAEDGSDLGRYDIVVLAVPAPQAIPLLAAAPQWATRVRDVSMLPCHAVMVAFEEALPVDFDAAFVRGSRLGWIARDGSKPGRSGAATWVLHSTPEWSTAHVDDEQDAVADQLLEGLAKAIDRPLPGIVHCGVHRWLYARPATPLADEPLWDPATGLGVCGDWTNGDRVEAAFTSAADLVSAILGR